MSQPNQLFNVFFELSESESKRFVSFGCFPKKETDEFERMFQFIESNSTIVPKIKLIVEPTPYNI